MAEEQDVATRLYKRFTREQVNAAAIAVAGAVVSDDKLVMIKSIIVKSKVKDYKELAKLMSGTKPERKEKEEARETPKSKSSVVKSRAKDLVVNRTVKRIRQMPMSPFPEGVKPPVDRVRVRFKDSDSVNRWYTFAPIRGAIRRVSETDVFTEEVIAKIAEEWGAKRVSKKKEETKEEE